MFNKNNALFQTTVTDLCYMIFYMLFIIYSTIFVPQLLEEIKGKKDGVLRTSDYAIMVEDIKPINNKILTKDDI